MSFLRPRRSRISRNLRTGWLAGAASGQSRRTRLRQDLAFEPLEMRRVLNVAGTDVIAGNKYLDKTGDGLTADDVPFQGVTIQLFRDNNDDVFNPVGDQLIASQQTDATGMYCFQGLASGTYWVRELVPTGYTRTFGQDPYKVVVGTAGQQPDVKDIVIDSFDPPAVAQSVLINLIDPDPSIIKQPGGLGGERDLLIDVLGNPIPISVAASAGAGSLFFSTAGTPGTTMTLQYDGLDADITGPPASLVNNEGLPNLDLTNGGFNKRLILDLKSVDGGSNTTVELKVNLTGPGGATASFTGLVPQNANPSQFIVPFTSFTLAGGFSFANVTSLQVQFNMSGVERAEFDLDVIKVGPPEPNGDFDFANAALPSSIAGFVYKDLDNDGIKDPGETPLQGVTVTLTGTDNFGNPVNTQLQTDANGFYKFSQLAPGTYKLTETQPIDCVDGKDTIGTPGGATTNDMFSNIQLPAGFDGVDNNFGELPFSSIAGFVYKDVDNDGIKDPGEAPIQGVTVTLTGTDVFGNPVAQQMQTDANGFYQFSNLVAGTYKLTETQPIDCADGKDTVGTPGGTTTNDMFSNIALPFGFDGVNNNFGELPFSSIAGFVYKDVDNDGVKDPGEAPIAGVTVTLTGTDVFGNPVNTQLQTDANGFYKFSNLVAGTYKLTETQPIDCADGKDTVGTPGGTTTNDMFSNIQLPAGFDGVNNNFGELPFSSIAGFVYKDTDNDGVKDPGEAPIAGVTVTLTGTDVFGNPVNTQLQTDANGFYKFSNLVAGTYKLTETQPIDCADGKDTVGTPGGTTTNDMFSNIQLPAGFDGVNNNFGELPFSSIAGFVYKDTDNDGVKDPGEAPIAGVTVTLTGTDVFGNPVNTQLQTDANGFYKFSNLVAGTYKLTETQPIDCLDGKDTIGTPGGVTTNDMFAEIPLPAGFDGVNNNFGELPINSSISGFVYKDTDNDGVKDPGEAPIQGVFITLTGNKVTGEPVNLQTQTDANGFYIFSNLAAGTYKLTETQPIDCADGKDTVGTPGGTTTNDMFSNIQLPAGFDGVNNNFGELPFSSIAGFVYKDTDNDGVKDPGEAPIAGVTVTLTGTDVFGNPVNTQLQTDANGFYQFSNLVAGTYKLTETQPIDCADGKDTVGTPGGTTTNDMFSNIQLPAGFDGVNNNFGELPFSSIAGFVYKDTDNDGVKDPGEAPIAGVTVTLTGTDVFGNPVNTQLQTDANGFYKFSNLVAGTYKLTETQPIDCADGKDTVGTPGGTTTNDMFSNIQLPAGFDGVNNNFGELPFSSIAGFVYKDTDNDGVKDPGEAPIAGVTVTLTGTDVFGNPVNTQLQTDANGFYKFSSLVAGTYKLTETQPIDCADGKDTVGTPGGTTTNDMFSNIQLPAGFDGVNNNFGELPFSSIAGFVYKDTDNDGVKDPGEAPIAGVTVTLTGTDVFGNPVNTQLQTDANGFYKFSNLVAGTYKLTETQPIDCADGKDTVGTPGGTTTNDMFSNIQLGPGVDGVENNFGELPFSSLAGCVYKDLDNDGIKDAGEAVLPGVTIILTGTDVFGNPVNKQVQTDANGCYLFDELVAGTYKLTEVQPVDCADGKDTIGTPGGNTVNDMFTDIQLGPGVDGVENNFGELPFSSLAGCVYKDLDNDGVKDAGEAPIPGVTIILTGTDVFGNPVNRQVQTGADGCYVFDDLVAGTYKLTEVQPVDCLDGKDTIGTPGGVTTNDMFSNIQLGPGVDGVNNNFGELPFSSISGHVYVDYNNNGNFDDPIEPPIPGTKVTLTGVDVFGNPVMQMTLTDANGYYLFDFLAPGTYKLTETQPIGFDDGKDTIGTPGGVTTNDMFANINLPPDFDGVNNDFGELKFSCLAGWVYVDQDDDGVLDFGELGIPGVKVTLTGVDVFGTPVMQMLDTNACGFYHFQNLIPGTYKITETQPNMFIDGKDTAGDLGGTVTNDMIADINLPFCTDGVQNNFGERGLKPEFISKGLLINDPLPNLPAAVPPTIKEIRDLVVTEGDTVWFDAMVFVPNGGPVKWSFGPGAPAGAALDQNTGEFHWTAPPTGGQQSMHNFKLLVEDRWWSKDDEDFKITVLPRTVVNNPPTALDDGYNVLEDSAATLLNVLGNDTALPDVGETLTIVQVSAGSNGGQISIANGGQQISYKPAANYVGLESFSYQISDGKGGFDIATVFVNVAGINDAPAFVKGPNIVIGPNNGVGIQVVAGQSTYANWATGITSGPGNEAGQSLNFMVTGNTNAGLFSSQPFVTPAGTLFFVAAPGASGKADITLKLQDNGGTANGGQDMSATQTFSITINPGTQPNNQAPINTVPSAQNVLEDGALTFSSGNGNAITVADPDAGSAPLRVTLAVTNGVLSLGGTTGLAFTTGDGVQDGTMTFTGTAAAINAALSGSVYLPNAQYNGPAQLTITTNDQGATGAGGALQDADTVNITVGPVNDAPSFTKGANQTVNQNSGSQTVAGWATNISSGPANESGQTVSLVVTNNTNAALFSAGPAVASNGTLTYTPANGASGSATITLRAQDNGGTANGGQDSSPTQTFTITVNAATEVNDPPVNNLPATQNVNEDNPLVLSTGNGNALSINDPDVGGGSLLVAINVTPGSGTLTLPGVSGLSFINGDGTADSAMSFSGTLASINAALNGLRYDPTGNFNGPATLSIITSDQGNTGSGGAKQDSDSLTINVQPVNDAPTFTKGPNVTVGVNSGASITPSWATNLSVGPANEILTQFVDLITVTADKPQLFAAQPVVTTSGILTFEPATNVSGTTTVSMQIRDDGGTANGGVNTSTVQTFLITIGQANQAPSFTKGANQTVASNGGAQTVPGWATSISPGPSTESWQSVNFLVSVDKPGLFSVQPSVAPNGTLTYTPNPAAAADSATISVRIMDNGGTANGGVDTSAIQTFTVGVTSSSTAPVLTPIGPLSIDELTDFNLQLMSTSGLPVTYSMQLGAGFDPSNLPQLTSGGLFSWLPLEDSNATQSVYSVTFRVTASDNQFDEETVQITVNEVNQAPKFSAIAPVDTIAGIPLALTFTASDDDLPPQGLTWSLSGGPVGNTATINPATGQFNWTPGAADANNTHVFNVTVTDNGSPNLSTVRQLSVNVAAAGSGPRINTMFVDDTGASNSDGVSKLVDLKGTVIFEGANLMAFTASFADAPPGAQPVDLLAEGVLTGSGNVRTLTLDTSTYISIRFQQGNGGGFDDGTYQLTLSAKDAANNVTTRVIDMTLDNTAPNAPSTLDLAPAFKNGDGTANAQVVTLIGVADPNVNVVLNNTQTTATNGAGAFTLTNVALNPANVATDLQLVAVDLAGNFSTPLARSITFKPAPAPAAARSAAEGNDDAPGHERHERLLVLRGTDGDDAFEVTVGETIVATLNGVRYDLDRSQYDSLAFDGLAGNNSVTIYGSSADETILARPTAATLAGAGYRVSVACATSLTIDGGGGNDRAVIRDSVTDDRLVAGPDSAELTGNGYVLKVIDVGNIRVIGSAGFDRAELSDSAGDDQFVARPDSVQMAGAGYLVNVRGFDTVRATGSTGTDTAQFYDSAGDDQFVARPGFAQLVGPGYLNTARGFDTARAQASAGRDGSVLYDSQGDDQLVARPNDVQLSGADYAIFAKGFDSNRSFATGGNDLASLYDSTASDRLVSRPSETQLAGPGFQNTAVGFDAVRAFASGGGDLADLYDSTGDDQFMASAGLSQLVGPGFAASAEAFAHVRAFSTGGQDSAVFHGEDGGRFAAVDRSARLTSGNSSQSALGFADVKAFGGGASQASLHDSALDSQLAASGKQATLTNAQIAYWLYDFQRVTASASNGFKTKEISAIDFVLEADDWDEL